MSAPNLPKFFCTRPSGTLTPLVAVDELPPHVSVRGVPRNLTPNDTQGMTSCGLAAPRAGPWVVEGVPLPPTAPRALAKQENLTELQNLLVNIIHENSISSPLRLAVENILYRAPDFFYPAERTVNKMSAQVPAFNGNNKQQAYNAKKEYCSYWIRHGECDYQQQGCLYKHEMPTDPAMLEKLGLRDIPRWYREKYNVPSLLWSGHGHPLPPSQPVITHDGPYKAIEYQTPVSDNGSTHAHTGNDKYQPVQNVRSIPVDGVPTPVGTAVPQDRGDQPNVSTHAASYLQKGKERAATAQSVTSGTPSGNSDDSFDLEAVLHKFDKLLADEVDPLDPTADFPTEFPPGFNFALLAKTKRTPAEGLSQNKRDLLTNVEADITNPSTQSTSAALPGTSKSLMDKGMANRNLTTQRLQSMNNQEAWDTLPPMEFPFRTKSRRLWERPPKQEASRPFFNRPIGRMDQTPRANKAPSSGMHATPSSGIQSTVSPMSELLSGSESLDPQEPLLNYGPIGGPVLRPPLPQGGARLPDPRNNKKDARK
ncbi:hypothetical protein NUU61_008114 [Penicillium alfredii]|uniref:C3H1-type domain-containing protein n=1 Tax=Penicillium alfredii TaxID=1506179 RepID=A0A9W9JZN9_9EURO|nr:uncharacterized protein NUU61_008114 [Penicillium alfredii]KAJ5086807.1 hypothetical protein NUU61_008114 [Penicillium alfredii]